jgi:hypothetical protein
MFSIFKLNPIKKLQKLHSIKLEQAMQAQRKGDIRNYASLTCEAELLNAEILAIANSTKE